MTLQVLIDKLISIAEREPHRIGEEVYLSTWNMSGQQSADYLLTEQPPARKLTICSDDGTM